MSKIYTKTGDKGKTSLISGHRVSKSHLRIEVYGTIDELNSAMGILQASKETPEEIRAIVIALQNKLFDLGAQFANDDEHSEYKLPDIEEKDIEFLERAIDKFTDQLPVLQSFILPGGHVLVANTHIARTICRRAERYAVALSEKYEINPIHIKYLNRLSDFLFVLARKMAFELGAEEVKWKQNVEYPEL